MGLRAMFDSISGLQSHNTWLDVIGNNISNVNTVAYKSSRVEFADQLSQTLAGASGDNPASNLGGVDPQQVGLGTRVASIQTIFAAGPTLTTGNSTDISIQGDGFLVSRNGSTSYLTRAGNLTFDGEGYLVDQNGGHIQGFNATLQYNRKPLVSFPQLFITDASFKLDDTNPAAATNIRISRDLVMPPRATTEVKFRGNLDSFQQANVLDLFPGGPFFGLPTLPVGINLAFIPLANDIDQARMTTQPTAGGGFTLKQTGNLSTFTPGFFPPPAPLVNEIINLGTVQAFAGNYAWEQQPPIPPAMQTSSTVYDSTGNPRQLSVLFYQCNDLGTAVPPINPPPGPSQACYAWYAFDTTGGKPVTTANLLGGTGIWQGDPTIYDRGNPILSYYGDFIWFNTDGSLGGSGGAGGFNGGPGLASNFMTNPRVYLPPENLPPPNPSVSPIPTLGAEIMSVDLDFGTFGLLGQGLRNGLTGDAEGSYQFKNGTNTYMPNNTVYAASQDGYADGLLQSVQFDKLGNIIGSFSNGQNAALAQVVMENVENPDGLNKVGSNYFTTSVNSGQGHLALAGQGNLGTIQGNSLEGSNVDLTIELSNMIVAQRGFEANARMISIINGTMDVTNNLGR
jgi:flagellar hook protein FlgE